MLLILIMWNKYFVFSGEERELAVDEEMDPLNVSEPDETLAERREDGIHEDIEPRPENTDKEENGADEETEPSRRENRSNERFIVTTEDGEGIKLVTTIKNVRG